MITSAHVRGVDAMQRSASPAHRLTRAAAFAGVLAACSSASHLAVRFEHPSGDAVSDTLRAVAYRGTLVIDGTFLTGECHLWASRGARLDGDTVTLRLREHGERFYGGCKDLGILSCFRATVGGPQVDQVLQTDDLRRRVADEAHEVERRL
jgi:hypothetical protein